MTACDQLSSRRSPGGVFEGGICISLNSGQVGRVTAIHGLKDRIECSKLVNSVVDQRASSERARAGRGRGEGGRGNDVDGQGICIQRKGHINTQLQRKETQQGRKRRGARKQEKIGGSTIPSTRREPYGYV